MRALLFAVVVANLLCCSFGSFPFPFVTPELCNSDEYFDSVCLKCKRCGSTLKNGQDSMQRLSRDGSCMCKPQYYLKERKGPHDILCASCSNEEVPSLDGKGCVQCSDLAPYNETLGLCEPCYNSITVEDGRKRHCVQCAPGSLSQIPTESCTSCSEDYRTSASSCSCISNVTLSDAHQPLVRNTPSLFTVKFENGISVRSAFFVEHFNTAYHNCKEYVNETACQLLANMCVMLMYKLDNRFTADDDACSEFLSLTKQQEPRCTVAKNKFGFWLLYSENAKIEMYRTNVPNEFSSNPALSSSKLQLVAVKYSLNGAFHSMSFVQSHNLQPCLGMSTVEDIAFTFGTLGEKQCEISTQELWDTSELLFYELYLVNKAGSNNSMAYPVPVLIKNVKVNGELVNQEEDISKWQLVHRFYITDAISGIEAGTSLESRRQPLSKVLRYASDISLIITVRMDGPPGSIFPPLLVLKYSEAMPDDYLRNKKLLTKFTVSYEMDQSESERGVSIAIGILSAVAVIWSLVQTWSWFRRAGKQAVDILTMGKFLVFSCGNLSTVFFIVVFCASLNWLAVFKMQDVVHLILPTHKQEKFLGTYLGISFGMKALEVIHLLAVQCNIDIFFIDWERPRNRSSSVANRSASGSGAKAAAESSAGSSSTKSLSGRGTPDKLSAEMAGISIWRTYFVANEWAEIQIMRKVNLGFQLFGTLFFLKVVGFEDYTFATPLSASNVPQVREIVPYKTCCRFAVGAAVYLSLALVQMIFRKGIYERFIEDKLQQYVDLCSVSNVSVFILVSKRFGYYIHGRSAHGKADVNMKEMHELLRREEEDLCGHRGLLPNTEQQTFLMALPIGVYEQFKRLLGPLTTYSQAADRMQGVGGRLSKVDMEKVVSTYHTMNKFLSGFIEHAFKDLDYIVKEKVMLETLLDIELYEANDRGYFYHDSGHSFDSVLLFGNESILLLFDVLLFCIIDVASTNYVLAAVLTYIVGKTIQALRLSAGRRNLVRKALVDERFLT